jgi:hypothetical protein
MTNKDTCWYGAESFHKEMVKAVKSHLPLYQVGHGKVLIELLSEVDKEDTKLLDLGCGGAFLSTVVKGEYTGSDMGHVIENISKVCYPDLNYISVDIIEDDLSYLKNYDIIVMNAIIDVMELPLQALDKVLKSCNEYVIIHRQDLSQGDVKITKQESYGGFTYHSNVGERLFKHVIKHNGFIIEKEINSGLGLPNNKSFLLKKMTKE